MSNDNKLREALELALNCHGKMLMTDPPQDAWRFHRVEEVAREALAATSEKAERGAVATLRRRSFDGVQTYALNPTESPDGSMAWEALPVGDYPLFLAAPPTQPAQADEVTRPYGMCSITGPKEDVSFVMRHLPDVEDAPTAPLATDAGVAPDSPAAVLAEAAKHLMSGKPIKPGEHLAWAINEASRGFAHPAAERPAQGEV